MHFRRLAFILTQLTSNFSFFIIVFVHVRFINDCFTNVFLIAVNLIFFNFAYILFRIVYFFLFLQAFTDGLVNMAYDRVQKMCRYIFIIWKEGNNFELHLHGIKLSKICNTSLFSMFFEVINTLGALSIFEMWKNNWTRDTMI